MPPQGKGSLYLRPLLLGSGPILGLGPAPSYTLVRALGGAAERGRRWWGTLVGAASATSARRPGPLAQACGGEIQQQQVPAPHLRAAAAVQPASG